MGERDDKEVSKQMYGALRKCNRAALVIQACILKNEIFLVLCVGPKCRGGAEREGQRIQR